jgi:hypothetical protein
MDITVRIIGEEVVVTRPGTDFLLAYRKATEDSNLVLTRSWAEPTVTSPGIAEFRLQAFQAAVSKARQMGWIV